MDDRAGQIPRVEGTLTRRQRTILISLLTVDSATRKSLGLRDSRSLWMMEERGLVARNLHDEWHITRRGKEALDPPPRAEPEPECLYHREGWTCPTHGPVPTDTAPPEGTDMRETREVTLTLCLPLDIAARAEEVHAAEPEFLERVVLYGLTRRSIYQAIRDREADDLPPPPDGVQPIPEEEGRAILAENRRQHDPGAGYSGYDDTILRSGEP